MKPAIFMGYDPREDDAFQAACASILRWHPGAMPEWPHFHPLNLALLRDAGLYRRETITAAGGLWDSISAAPMSTEFAISRFLTPLLARWNYQAEWALFMDCDILMRTDPAEIFALADPRYAVQVVKHDHQPAAPLKMDGQAQLAYPRKNWSSVILWNCAHPANAALDLGVINSLPGRDLHRFCWLPDELIGELPRQWNHLVGVDAPDPGAKIAHFTLGIPRMAGYEDCEFADEWRALCPA